MFVNMRMIVSQNPKLFSQTAGSTIRRGRDVCRPFYFLPGTFSGTWLICLILLLNSLFPADGTFSNFLNTISKISCAKFAIFFLLNICWPCWEARINFERNRSQFVFDLVQSCPTPLLPPSIVCLAFEQISTAAEIQ